MTGLAFALRSQRTAQVRLRRDAGPAPASPGRLSTSASHHVFPRRCAATHCQLQGRIYRPLRGTADPLIFITPGQQLAPQLFIHAAFRRAARYAEDRTRDSASCSADGPNRRYGAGVTAMRVILVSDTHLSPAAPEAAANWDAVLRYVGANAPDVVIHLGDLTLDGAHNAGDLHYGRRQLDRLPVPWHAIPGNHDIGDNPWPGAPGDFTVDPPVPAVAGHRRHRPLVGDDERLDFARDQRAAPRIRPRGRGQAMVMARGATERAQREPARRAHHAQAGDRDRGGAGRSPAYRFLPPQPVTVYVACTGKRRRPW